MEPQLTSKWKVSSFVYLIFFSRISFINLTYVGICSSASTNRMFIYNRLKISKKPSILSFFVFLGRSMHIWKMLYRRICHLSYHFPHFMIFRLPLLIHFFFTFFFFYFYHFQLILPIYFLLLLPSHFFLFPTLVLVCINNRLLRLRIFIKSTVNHPHSWLWLICTAPLDLVECWR